MRRSRHVSAALAGGGDARRRAGKPREPARCGVALDNPFAHRLAQGFIDRLDLACRGFLILGFDRLARPFHQSPQLRFGFDIAGSLLKALTMTLYSRLVNNQGMPPKVSCKFLPSAGVGVNAKAPRRQGHRTGGVNADGPEGCRLSEVRRRQAVTAIVLWGFPARFRYFLGHF